MIAECPKILCNVPIYSGVEPIPFMHFVMFSAETGRAEAAGKYKLKWNVGGPKSSVILIRNAACGFAIEGEATHLLLIDDDMLVPYDLLDKLLPLDLPIVAPIFFRSTTPTDPLVFDINPENGNVIPIVNYPVDSVFKAPGGVGTGVMLIKTEVLKMMERPWFRYEYNMDLEFCRRASKIGFDSYCNSSILVQQMGKNYPVGRTQWDIRRMTNGQTIH